MLRDPSTSSSVKLEPWYLPGTCNPPPLRLRLAAPRLLAASLDVVLDELLGVLLEDLVDLVDEGVHLLLELLAALGELLGPPSLSGSPSPSSPRLAGSFFCG